MKSLIIGISGLSPREYRASSRLPTLSELDLASYLGWTPTERRHLFSRLRDGHRLVGCLSSAWLFVRTGMERPDVERMTILDELREELKPESLIIRVQARHADLAHDFGKAFHLDWPRPLRDRADRASAAVWDPMWDTVFGPAESSSAVLKIHGWHTARWIRRYSNAQIEECARRVVRNAARLHGKTLLLIGHSQRREQWQEFESAFKLR